MAHVWSDDVDSILSVGRYLEEVGVRNWALQREEALLAVERLRAINVAVLGGDVCSVKEGRVEANYDSWHCDRDRMESDIDFVERSAENARSYIVNYKAPMGSVLFAIVPDA